MDRENQRINSAFYAVMASLIFFTGIMPFLVSLIPEQMPFSAPLRIFLAAYLMPVSFILIAFITAAGCSKGEKEENKRPLCSILTLTVPDRQSVFLASAGTLLIFLLLSLTTHFFILILQKAGIHVPEQGASILLKTSDRITTILLIPAIVILAPLGEELAFRHIIYRKFASLTTPFYSVLLTAFFFSVVHMNVRVLPALFGLSLYLSYLCRDNRSLISSILAHSVFNSISTVLLLLMRNQIIPG